MLPESSSIEFRTDLSELAREFDAEKAAKKFVAMKAAPIYESPVSSAGYPIFDRESFKKPADTKRQMSGAYNRITGTFGKGTFDTEEHGLEYPIDERRRLRYETLFDAEAAANEILRYQLLLAWELRVASMYANAGFTNHNVTTAWSTAATAVPLDDIQTGVETLEDKCGVNGEDISLIIPRADFREFLRTAQVVDKSKYTNPGVQPSLLQATQVAAMLGIKEVLIAKSSYDSKEEGVAESMSQAWAAGVMYLVVLAEEGDSLETMSAARTALWTRRSPELPVVETYPQETIDANIVRMRDDTDEFLQGEADLFAYKLTNT